MANGRQAASAGTSTLGAPCLQNPNHEKREQRHFLEQGLQSFSVGGPTVNGVGLAGHTVSVVTIVRPLIRGFAFHGFSYPRSAAVKKY